MKPLRSFFRYGSLSLACCLAFSCVDESYDLEKADYQIQVLDNGISLPVGSFELGMDSILKVDGSDSAGLKLRGNMYYISTTSKMDVADLNSTIEGFSLEAPANVEENIAIPTEFPAPYDVPVGSKDYNSAITTTLPPFSTDLIDVKSVDLKNTTFTMRANTYNMAGNNLNNSITITCTPQDNVAEYYVNGAKVTSWSMKANEDKVVEIHKLDVSSSNALNISCVATINVASAGAVRVLTNAPSIKIAVQFNGIDFKTVHGKITYSKSDSQTEAFEGFGELLNGDQNVLSFYNPSIKIKWRENLGVPIQVGIGMNTKNTLTNQTASLSNTTFTMAAAATPSAVVVDSFTINRSNGTANLFKINPNEITTSYSIQTDASTSNHFISKNVILDMESTFELPVQFESDLLLSIGDTITNPFLSMLDKLAEQEDLGFGVAFDVTNRIPLSMKIKLIAENEAGDSIFSAETDEIAAASGIDDEGFATVEEKTSTSLTLTADQIDQIKDIARFRYAFVVSASQSDAGFVTISQTDYIKMNVAAVITGGVILDLNKQEEE